MTFTIKFRVQTSENTKIPETHLKKKQTNTQFFYFHVYIISLFSQVFFFIYFSNYLLQNYEMHIRKSIRFIFKIY